MKQRNLQEMNPSHGKVLFALSQNDMISIQELKEKVALGSSTLTGILDHLEKLDMINRIHSKEDRRKILIRFNEKDYNKLENYKAIVKKLTKIIYQDLSEDEIKTFESNLIHIFQNLSEYEKSLN
jgi:DNA-binding MarR family transcriptional regulator